MIVVIEQLEPDLVACYHTGGWLEHIRQGGSTLRLRSHFYEMRLRKAHRERQALPDRVKLTWRDNVRPTDWPETDTSSIFGLKPGCAFHR